MPINFGYYIKARCIKNSFIAHAPPYVREIWDYLLREANHTDKKYNGFIIKRGQLFRTYKEIREDLSWSVGYRKMMYNENHTKKAMRVLTRELMISTMKEPRGVLITICNYDYYQDPQNYERTNESTNEGTTKEPTGNQGVLSINNKEKKVKKEIIYPDWLSRESIEAFIEMRKKLRKPLTDKALEMTITKLSGFRDKGHNPNEILNDSVMHSWQGVFEPKMNNNKPNDRNYQNKKAIYDFVTGGANGQD